MKQLVQLLLPSVNFLFYRHLSNFQVLIIILGYSRLITASTKSILTVKAMSLTPDELTVKNHMNEKG